MTTSLDRVRETILAKTRGSYGQSVKECFDIFRKWGGVKRGKDMDFSQFSMAMKACGIGSRQAAYKLFNLMDVNHTGKIEFAEFARGIMGKDATRLKDTVDWGRKAGEAHARKLAKFNKTMHAVNTKEELKRILRMKLATKGSEKDAFVYLERLAGTAAVGRGVNRKAFALAMTKMNMNASDAAVNSLYRDLDPNNDGTVDFNEFTNIMMGSKKSDLTSMVQRKDTLDSIKHAKAAKHFKRQQHVAKKAYKAIDDPLAILKRKLKQRTSGQTGMLKIFKKFREIAQAAGDSINFPQFKQALYKLELRVSDIECRKAFAKLDTDHSGYIDYQEFLEKLLGKDVTGLATGTDWGVAKAKQSQVIKDKALRARFTINTAAKLRNALQKKAVEMGSPWKAFNYYRKIGGSDGKGIRLQQFKTAITHSGMFATEEAVEALFKQLDSNPDGSVDFKEFAKGVLQFDKEAQKVGQNFMTGDALDAQKRQRAKDRENALKRHHDSPRSSRGTPGRTLGPPAPQIASARHRAHVSRGTSRRGPSADPIKVLGDHLKQLVSGDGMVLKLFKRFRQQAQSRTNKITYSEFRKALTKAECHVSDTVAHAAFRKLDKNKDGSIDFKEFVKVFMAATNTGSIKNTDWGIKRAKEQQRRKDMADRRRQQITDGEVLRRGLRKKAEDIGSELKAFVHFKKEAGDGGLDMEGFERAVDRSGFNASQTAIRQLFNALDPNSDGKIDFKEFEIGVLGDWSKKVGGTILSERDEVDQKKRTKARARQLANERMAHRVQQERFKGSEEEILEQLRQRIASQIGGAGKLLKAFKMFRESAHSAQNKVDFAGFKTALFYSGVDLPIPMMHKLFNSIDVNGDGMIDFYEFSDHIAKADDPTSLQRTNDWAVTRAKFLSDNKSKRIKQTMIKRDAKQLLSAIQDRAAQANDMAAAFRRFLRVSGSKGSKVSKEQFQSVIDNAHDHTFGNTAIKDVFEQLDTNGDGYIDFNEFVEGVFSGKLKQPKSGRPKTRRPNSNPDSKTGRVSSRTDLSGILSVKTTGSRSSFAQFSPIKKSTDSLILGMRSLGKPQTKVKGSGSYQRRDRGVALNTHLKNLMRSY